MLLFMLALLVGCGRDYADPATLAATLEPTTVFAELSTTDRLSQAGEQFATTLNLDPTSVRVRIKPGNCTVCSLASRPEIASIEGVTVSEAETIIKPNDEVSLFIPKFSCTFVYDGETFTPKQCQPSPL